MATAAKHDVPLTLSVDTVGLESIKQLKSDIAALGKEGASATPEFAKLAAEIDKLADQSKLVTSFGQLTDEVEQLAAAQSLAGQRAKGVAGDLDAQRDSTDKLRVAEQGFKDELVAAQRALFDKRQELAALKNTTTDYAAEARVMTAAIIEAKTEVRNLADAHKEAKVETAAAALEEGKLASQLKTLTSVSDAANTKLSERNTALRDTKVALDAAGGSTADYATAEAALGAAFIALNTKVEDHRLALVQAKAAAEEMANADRLLAIEQKGLADLFEKGRVALIAEETAFREATRSSAAYSAAREAESVARAKAAELWQKEADAIVSNVQAKERNLKETRLLIEAQNFMAVELAKDKWLVEAAAMGKANEAAFALRRQSELLADAQKTVATDAQAAAVALKTIDDAAKEAGDGIANALGIVGVRSAAEIRIEIDKVKVALSLLQTSGTLVGNELDAAFAKGASKVKALERDLREATGQMTLADKAARLFSGAMGQFTAANLASDAVMRLVQGVQDLGRSFIDAVVQGDSMTRGLTAIYKDAGVAASQIDFLRKSAMENGVAVGQLGTEFVKFSASMNSANIPLQQSNDLFNAVTRASASLGIGTEATAGALNALGQMASKGTVSMEELRQQLGDRLPGALGLAAQGLGITEAQLVSLVGTGQLAARDFFGPFTEALKTMAGETDGLINTFDRMKTALTQTAQSAGDAGWTQLLTVGLKALATAIGLVVLPLTALSELIFGVAKAGGVLVAAVVTWTNPWEALGKILTDAAGRQAKLNDAFDAAVGSGNNAAKTADVHAVAMSKNTAEAVKAINANVDLDGAQKLVALSAALAGDKTLDAATKIVQYSVAAADLIKSQGAQTDAYDKLAKAQKEEGETLVTLAKLSGDENAARKAGVVAADAYAKALEKVSVSGATEVAMLTAQKAELIANATSRQGGVKAVESQVKALDDLILKATAEAAQSLQSTKAAQAEAFARQLIVAALKDHSGEIVNLKAAMDVAAITLAEYEKLAINGKKTEEEVLTARRNLTQATALYKDGISDLIAKTELDTRVKVSNMNVQIAQISSSQNHYTALANEARALGDTEKAAQLDIKAKEEGLRILKLKLQLAELEQKAALLEIEQKAKIIDKTTDEGKAKLQVLEIEKNIIKIKQAGNVAAQDAIKAMEKEIDAAKKGLDKLGGSGETAGSRVAGGMNVATGATKQLTASLYDAVSAAGKLVMARADAAEAMGQFLVSGELTREAKRLDGIDKEKNSRDSKLNNMTQGGNYLTILGAYNEAKSAGVPEAEALRIAEEFGIDPAAPISGTNVKKWDPRRFQMAVSEASVTAKKNAVADSATDPTSVRNRNAASAAGKLPGAGAAAGSGASPANIVNVNIGGVSTAINVSSQSDANNLQTVLRQLASAQGRSV